jgi:hypothetical protein
MLINIFLLVENVSERWELFKDIIITTADSVLEKA